MCVLDWASYPVRVRGVGPREDVQQVVTIPGQCDAAFTVDSTMSAAGGAFVTLLAIGVFKKKKETTWCYRTDICNIKAVYTQTDLLYETTHFQNCFGKKMCLYKAILKKIFPFTRIH